MKLMETLAIHCPFLCALCAMNSCAFVDNLLICFACTFWLCEQTQGAYLMLLAKGRGLGWGGAWGGQRRWVRTPVLLITECLHENLNVMVMTLLCWVANWYEIYGCLGSISSYLIELVSL